MRRNWARLLKKVYEVDPLICAQCGGTMRVVALIEKPQVIKRILDHLKLCPTDDAGRAPPSPASAGSSPTETHVEALFDDLPWEEPTFEDGQFHDEAEPELDADGPSEGDDAASMAARE